MHPPRTEEQCKANREAAAFVGKHSVCIRLAPKSSANQTDKVAAIVGKHTTCYNLAPKSSAKQTDKAAAIVGKQLLL